MSSVRGTLLIGGGDVEGGGASFAASDPVTGDRIEGVFRAATEEQIELAVGEAARAAAPFERTTGAERGAFLRAIGDCLRRLSDSWLERAGLETGLPAARLLGERDRTLRQIELFAGVVEEGSWVDARINRGNPSREPPKPDLRSMLVPLGPVAVFGSSNFPLAFSIAGGDTVSALAAGCPVVAKAHPAHPGTCELAGRAIQQAVARCGLDAGVFGMVQGAEPRVGEALVLAGGIEAVGFTGSFRGGQALLRIANGRAKPIPCFAEMGSANPVVVLGSALGSEDLACRLVDSALLACGQFCTSPGLVFVPRGPEGDAFAEHLAARWRAAVVPGMVHCAIAEAQRGEADEVAALPGVRLLAEASTTPCAAFARPLLLEADASLLARRSRLCEEIYGPLSIVVRYGGRDELLDCLSLLKGQLTATLCGSPEELRGHGELRRRLARMAGRILFSGVPTGVEVGYAMQHGGPWPASSDARFTSVGASAIRRWARPLCYQDAPGELLPPALRDGNPLGIRRTVDGRPSLE
ncbi:MAG: aldehyde dehydrogenase (NADP(+)) [Planctomycetota bacterium]